MPLKSYVNRFYSFVDVKVIFRNTGRIKSFSKVIYKASCWDCNDSIGKTKRRLHDQKTEPFNVLSKRDQSSAIAFSSPEAALFFGQHRELRPLERSNIEASILVPRDRDPFGQLRGSRPLARSNDIPVLNGFVNTID